MTNCWCCRTDFFNPRLCFLSKICNTFFYLFKEWTEVIAIYTDISSANVANIIITDESTVEIDCHKPGIWRRRGHHPLLSLYNAEQKPKTVMVWAGIGPGGYRTELLRVKGRLNSEAYCNLLINNGIVKNLNDTFGTNYIFQQDNAPCHRSAFTKDTLLKKFPAYLNWPAKSPDLSPIEQLWHYLKKLVRKPNFFKH